MSIRGKLTFLFSIIILTVCVALGVLSYQNSSNLVIEESEKMLMNKAKDDAIIIAERFNNRFSQLEELAARDEILSMNWEEQESVLKKEVKRLNHFLTIAVVDKDGVAKYIDGNTVDLKDRDYIKKALAGKSNISDVLISRLTGEPVIMIAVPIKNEQINGALIARIDGFYLSEITNDIKIGETGYTFIINQDGTMMAHPDKELVRSATNLIKKGEEEQEFQSVSDALKRAQKGNEGIEIYEFREDTRYNGYAKVEGTNWTLLTGASKAEIIQPVQQLKTKMIIISVILIALGLVISYFVALSITKPLGKVIYIAEKISNGDFSEKVDGKILDRKDEIGLLGKSFDHISINLKEIISKVMTNAEYLKSSTMKTTEIVNNATNRTEAITSSVMEIAKGSEDMTHTSAEASNAMNEISVGIHKVAESSTVVSENSSVMNERAKNGNDSIKETIRQMNKIDEKTNDTTSIIGYLVKDAKEISRITNMITEISDQTNLLALNASIEAARAGEHGKGFAVVAEEVRKLAEESAKSSSEINQLITTMQENTNKAVHSMSEGQTEVQNGIVTVNKVGEAFAEILSSIESVSLQVEELSAVSEEMSASSEEVTSSVEGMADVANKFSENTNNVEYSVRDQLKIMNEIVSSSSTLNEMADELMKLVNQFKIN